MRLETDKLTLVVLLLAAMLLLWLFRDDHDAQVYIQGVATTLLGGLLGLVRAETK